MLLIDEAYMRELGFEEAAAISLRDLYLKVSVGEERELMEEREIFRRVAQVN